MPRIRRTELRTSLQPLDPAPGSTRAFIGTEIPAAAPPTAEYIDPREITQNSQSKPENRISDREQPNDFSSHVIKIDSILGNNRLSYH